LCTAIFPNAASYFATTARRRKAEEVDPSSLKDTLSVEWLAELQQAQDNETQFTADVIGDKVRGC